MDYSVLMSVYSREKAEYLKQAVSSMLEQTILPKEFVLVCDGPLGPKLTSVVEEYEKNSPELFKIVRLPENRGLSSALNEGLKECTCEWIARMDSDDISLSTRIEKQCKLAQVTGAGLLSGTVAEFGRLREENENASEERAVLSMLIRAEAGGLELPKRSLPETDEEIRKFARKRNPMNHPAVLMRRDAVNAVGGYSTDFPYFEDYDLWLRMLKNGVKAANEKEVILLMRADEGLYDRRGGKEYRAYMKAFRKRMLREKDCSRWDYISSLIVRSIVAIAPTGLRRKFYGKVLRK